MKINDNGDFYVPAKCRITLKTTDAIHDAVEWAVKRNRGFQIMTNHLALGWSIDIDILPDENPEDLSEIFNVSKTKTP